MTPFTEQDSSHNHLEKQSISELLQGLNEEDKTVPIIVQKAIPQIDKAISAAEKQLKNNGRLFYIGAGTSGRLAITDASECPPTFGVPQNLVIAIIAGGDSAIRKAVEFAEDNTEQGWLDLLHYQINTNDFLIGISASGKTPYTVSALKNARENNIPTACITNNYNTLLANVSDYPIELETGAEFLTGSTRLKAGTSQKLVLNMITTTLMIRLGKVLGNKMIDMQLTNEKLIDRATRYLCDMKNIDYQRAKELLLAKGSLRKALE